MSNLPPAARATYDAFNRVGFALEPSFETDRKALAAAIRAAADQVVPPLDIKPQEDLESRRETMEWGMNNQTQITRQQLLAIADELEDIKYGTYRSPLPTEQGKTN